MPAAATESHPSLRDTIDGDPYGFYDAVRAAGDVVWDDGLSAWLVTSSAAIRELMRQDKVAVRHSALTMTESTPALARVLGGPRSRLLLSGEIHAQHHKWFIQRFSYALADQWRETLIRPIIDRLLDDVTPHGRADLLIDFADRFSIRVISAILGFPWQDDAFVDRCKGLLDRKQAFINLALIGASEQDTRLALEATDELEALVMPFVEAAREREPHHDDILACLWAEGPTIRPDWNVEDVLAWITTTYFAGTDTTTHALQNALYLLMTVDGLQDDLRTGGPEAISRYTDEIVRLYPSVHFTHRLANVDFELCGVAIKAEDGLFVLNAGGNRDPERYPCPAQIDLERPQPKGHLGFSVGPRMCAGSALARAEIEESVAAVLTRMPNLRLDPDAEQPQLKGFVLRSYAPLHVVFDPTSGDDHG